MRLDRLSAVPLRTLTVSGKLKPVRGPADPIAAALWLSMQSRRSMLALFVLKAALAPDSNTAI